MNSHGRLKQANNSGFHFLFFSLNKSVKLFKLRAAQLSRAQELKRVGNELSINIFSLFHNKSELFNSKTVRNHNKQFNVDENGTWKKKKEKKLSMMQLKINAGDFCWRHLVLFRQTIYTNQNLILLFIIVVIFTKKSNTALKVLIFMWGKCLMCI